MISVQKDVVRHKHCVYSSVFAGKLYSAAEHKPFFLSTTMAKTKTKSLHFNKSNNAAKERNLMARTGGETNTHYTYWTNKIERKRFYKRLCTGKWMAHNNMCDKSEYKMMTSTFPSNFPSSLFLSFLFFCFLTRTDTINVEHMNVGVGKFSN